MPFYEMKPKLNSHLSNVFDVLDVFDSLRKKLMQQRPHAKLDLLSTNANNHPHNNSNNNSDDVTIEAEVCQERNCLRYRFPSIFAVDTFLNIKSANKESANKESANKEPNNRLKMVDTF